MAAGPSPSRTGSRRPSWLLRARPSVTVPAAFGRSCGPQAIWSGRYALPTWPQASGKQTPSTRPCRPRIAQAGARASFSRPGNPYNNAQAEASWSTLKSELLPQRPAFASRAEARLEVVHYLATCFTLARRYSALDYRSPHPVEADLLNHRL